MPTTGTANLVKLIGSDKLLFVKFPFVEAIVLTTIERVPKFAPKSKDVVTKFVFNLTIPSVVWLKISTPSTLIGNSTHNFVPSVVIAAFSTIS